MLRAYYGKSIADFIQEDNLNILGTLAKNHGYQTLVIFILNFQFQEWGSVLIIL